MNSDLTAELEEAVEARESAEEVSVEPPAPEQQPQNPWVELGFLADIATVCKNLDDEQERFTLSGPTRRIIERLDRTVLVEDLADLSDDQLFSYMNSISSAIPNAQGSITRFLNRLNRARTVAVDDVDFI